MLYADRYCQVAGKADFLQLIGCRRLNVRNKRSADITSKYHLLIDEVRLRIVRQFNIRRLEDPAVIRSLVEDLGARTTDFPGNGSLEEQWTTIKNAIIETSDINLGKLRTQRKEWITDAFWRKIEERIEANAAIERARTRVAKRESRQQYSTRAWMDSMASEGKEKAAKTGDFRLLYDS